MLKTQQTQIDAAQRQRLVIDKAIETQELEAESLRRQMDECLKEMQRGFAKVFKMHDRIGLDMDSKVSQAEFQELLETMADRNAVNLALS